jgi:hypothetical protein
VLGCDASVLDLGMETTEIEALHQIMWLASAVGLSAHGDFFSCGEEAVAGYACALSGSSN